MNNQLFIAEIKTESPFGFKSDKDRWDLFQIACRYGDIIAAHTEPQFGGSLDWVKAVRARTPRDKLVLAKGIHPYDGDVIGALDAGADLVTVVGRPPSIRQSPVCIFEPEDFMQFVFEGQSHHKVMWNARDLKTGQPRKERSRLDDLRYAGWLCQASFIEKPEDVHPDVDAFIVGEHLEEFCHAKAKER